MQQPLINSSWTHPSKLAGWGVVVAVHLLMWQVFAGNLNFLEVIPTLQPTQVVLLEEQPPPMPPTAPLPKTELILNNEIYVPTPEVMVSVESSLQLSDVTNVPVTAVSIAPVKSSDADAAALPVVEDSEVDYLVRPEIRYPLASKRAHEQGTVLLSVIIDEHGLVRHVRVFRSSGHTRLDDMALRALRALRVKPYRRNGTPLAVEIRVPVEFSLKTAA